MSEKYIVIEDVRALNPYAAKIPVTVSAPMVHDLDRLHHEAQSFAVEERQQCATAKRSILLKGLAQFAIVIVSMVALSHSEVTIEITALQLLCAGCALLCCLWHIDQFLMVRNVPTSAEVQAVFADPPTDRHMGHLQRLIKRNSTICMYLSSVAQQGRTLRFIEYVALARFAEKTARDDAWSELKQALPRNKPQHEF